LTTQRAMTSSRHRYRWIPTTSPVTKTCFEYGRMDPVLCHCPVVPVWWSVSAHLRVPWLQNSVWPETNKLLGHSNEVVCVVANSKGTLLASVCKVSMSMSMSMSISVYVYVCGVVAPGW
jgi:hypothetical protein